VFPWVSGLFLVLTLLPFHLVRELLTSIPGFSTRVTGVLSADPVADASR
jgi:hypothetical protein